MTIPYIESQVFLWLEAWNPKKDFGAYRLGEQRRLRWVYAYAQTRLSLHCLHTRSMNVDLGIDIYSYSCLHPLSNKRKSMLKSGDSRAVWTWVWTWKYLKWALHYLHNVIYGKRCGLDWSFRRCFCSRKRCARLWRCDDVMTFESTQPTPFCLKKSCVRKWTI